MGYAISREYLKNNLKPVIEDWKHTIYLWRKTPMAMAGFIIFVAFVVTAVFAPALAPYDPNAQDLKNQLQPPSVKNFLGTDQYGRDIFSRVIMGTRVELQIICIVSFISVTIGVIIGLLAGYFGRFVDEAAMRITDMFMAFPQLILAMAFTSAFGANLTNTILAISLVDWTTYARLVRAESRKIKTLPYIEAIRAVGASNSRIMVFHVLPMCLSPVIVQMSLRAGSIILTAAGLGFLGLGAQPPTPEWGIMVSEGRSYLVQQWWISTFPGLTIAAIVFGLNLLGDGIRDIIDPRIRR